MGGGKEENKALSYSGAKGQAGVHLVRTQLYCFPVHTQVQRAAEPVLHRTHRCQLRQHTGLLLSYIMQGEVPRG